MNKAQHKGAFRRQHRQRVVRHWVPGTAAVACLSYVVGSDASPLHVLPHPAMHKRIPINVYRLCPWVCVVLTQRHNCKGVGANC